MFERLFLLRERGTTLQPSVLSTDFAGEPTGLEPGAVLLATCLASAFAMGLWGKLPIGLAPGMGQNFFFVSVVMSMGAAYFVLIRVSI